MKLQAIKKILLVKTLLSLTLFSISSDGYVSINLINIGNHPETETTTETKIPTHIMTYPIEKVLDWQKAPKELWNADYKTIPKEYFTPLPNYNPQLLITDWQTLNLTEQTDQKIYNLKKTYPAVFMGNYKTDGHEYAGSHTGIDIRTPLRTPVRAFASGKVVKAAEQSFGFGNHISIAHENFPTLENPTETTTYYSTYAHLDKLNVELGQDVRAGQIIGYTGSTGASSVEHLHFQIDRANSPAVPYWPLNSLLLSKLDLTFAEAINQGIGREEALKYVINPLEYINKYTNNDLIFSDLTLSDDGGNEILSLKDKGFFEGYEDGSFRPDSNISRAEALKLITLLKNDEFQKYEAQKTQEEEKIVFIDVQNSYWFSDLVAYAYSNGIVSGYPDGSFKPEQEVLGVEFLKMMLETTNKDHAFQAKGNEAWYSPYIQSANQQDLLTQNTDYLKPITRREVAKLIYRQLHSTEEQ